MIGRDYLRNHLLSAIAGGITLVAAAMLLMSGVYVLQLVGGVLAAALVVFWLALPFIDARSMERHIEANPAQLKNEAIGKSVTVCGSFRLAGEVSAGHVFLYGEKWSCRCTSVYFPSDGEVLLVQGREGLTLVVGPQNNEV